MSKNKEKLLRNNMRKVTWISLDFLLLLALIWARILILNINPIIDLTLNIVLSLILCSILLDLYFIQAKLKKNVLNYNSSIKIALIFYLGATVVLRNVLMSSLLIGLISLFIIINNIQIDDEYKILFNIIIPTLYFYLSFLENIMLFSLILFGLALADISFTNPEFRNRLISIHDSFRIKRNSPNPKELDKKVLFWQARVKINQGILDKKEGKEKELEKIENTWFQDYFSNSSQYVVKLVANKKFSLDFLLKTRSKSEARISGEALLTRLTSIFPGLDGFVEVKPIYETKIYKNYRYWEIRLPKPPFIDKVSLFNDFINLYHLNDEKIKLFILWKKVKEKNIQNVKDAIKRFKSKDEKEKQKLLDMWQGDLFKIRIFLRYEFKSNKNLDEKLEIIEGRLNGLTLSCRNIRKTAKLKRVSLGVQGEILRVNLISGTYITSRCIDFTMFNEMPLSKPFSLANENIIHAKIDENSKDYILAGVYINNGRKTNQTLFFHKNHFAQSTLIVGQQGTGKTYFLAQILKEFHVKVPNVGILILNLGKGNQEHFYACDEVIKFGDENLRVPYYHPGRYPDKSMQETAEYLIASLGLKNVAEKNMLNVMQAFISKKGNLPKSLNVLFENLVKYFNDFPYHVKFQTNILRAIKNRVLSLLSNPNIENTMRLPENRIDIPQWFNDWKSGKKIYLDLSMCSLYEKRLLTSAIFQLVRSITPDFEATTLKNIIVIDEAHQILEKSISKNYEDDDFIAREQLEKIFNQLLREFRSKGLSFIIADQTPSRLFESVTTLPSLKVIFRVGFPCNTTLLGNPVEQDFLMCQKNRQALVLNGITGEKFIMETIQVEPEQLHVKDQINLEELPDYYPCPFCKEIIQKTDLLCPYCVESVLPNPLDD